MKRIIVSVVLAVSVFLSLNAAKEEKEPVKEYTNSFFFYYANSDEENDPGSMH